MTQVRTNLDSSFESARQLRFEPTGSITQTNVQKALEEATSANGTFQHVTITPPAGLNQGLLINQTVSGTSGVVDLNKIFINGDTVDAGSGFLNGLAIVESFGGSATKGGRQLVDILLSLDAATSATNANRFYVGAVVGAQAQASDGGGVGTEKGSLFALNPFVLMKSAATSFAEASVAEFDTRLQAGSSTLIKYGIKITQVADDAVAGSVQDAALFFGNQVGAVGWGTLIQIGDGVFQSPLKTTGSVLATKGSPIFTNGIDFSGATITGHAFTAVQTGTGTHNTWNFSDLTINSDNIVAGTTNPGINFVNGVQVNHTFGGAATKGGRNAIFGWLTLGSTTNAANPYNFNAALLGYAWSAVGVTDATAYMYGVGTTARVRSGSTIAAVIAGELTVGIEATGAAGIRAGLILNGLGGDTGKGSTEDTLLVLTNQPGAAKFDTGIKIGDPFASGTAPLETTGTIFKASGSQTVLHGIDLSSWTFGGGAFKSPGFSVDGAAKITQSRAFISGIALLDITGTQTAPNSTDTADSLVTMTYTLSASSATNELVNRILKINFTNSLTGGGVITNARMFEVVANTSASTTITNLENIYITGGTTSGTVTTGYGVHIGTLQGTTKWGVADDSGSNWYNTGFIKTGVTTVGALPAAAAGNRGARHFVTDANATFTAGIGAVVAAGGANNVPVVSDGAAWRIG